MNADMNCKSFRNNSRRRKSHFEEDQYLSRVEIMASFMRAKKSELYEELEEHVTTGRKEEEEILEQIQDMRYESGEHSEVTLELNIINVGQSSNASANHLGVKEFFLLLLF